MIKTPVAILLVLGILFAAVMTGPMNKTLISMSRTVPPEPVQTEIEAEDEPVLLIDFCRRTVATVGGDGYSETVLWLYPDGSTQVHFYDWYEYYDGEENHTRYIVDNAVIDAAYALIEKYDFAGWENRKDLLPGMTGAQIILKYRAPDGSYVRVTTDSAPEEGQNQMYDVIRCVTDYVHFDGE